MIPMFADGARAVCQKVSGELMSGVFIIAMLLVGPNQLIEN